MSGDDTHITNFTHHRFPGRPVFIVILEGTKGGLTARGLASHSVVRLSVRQLNYRPELVNFVSSVFC